MENLLQYLVYPLCAVLSTMALIAIANHLEDISDNGNKR
jgi:hypothetical protein